MKLSDVMPDVQTQRLSQVEGGDDSAEKPKTDALTALWHGLLRGGRDLLEGGAQVGARMGEAPQIGQTGPEMPGGAARIDQAIKQSNQSYNADPARVAHPILGGAGRLAGNVAPAAALAAVPGVGGAAGGLRSAAGLLGSGAALGAAGAASQPVAPGSGDYWAEKLKQVGAGAAVGAALPAVGSAIAPRLPAPQNIGKAFRPLWNFVTGAEERTVDGFDRTIARQVLDPIGAGGQITKNLSGHALAAKTEDTLSAAYDRVLPHVSLSRNAIVDAASPETHEFVSELDPLEGKQFETFVQNKLLRKIPEDGRMDGATFKQVQRDFGSRATSYLGTQKDALGRALLMTQSDLNDALAKENPQWAPELSRINESWKMWTRMRQAAAGATGNGKFMPRDFLRSVRQQDPTAGHRAFARGDAVLQGYAEAADKAMSTRSNPMELMHIFSRHGLPMEMARQVAGPAGRAAKTLTPYAAGPAGAVAGQATPKPAPREPRISVTGP